jgi:hypothetical protein
MDGLLNFFSPEAGQRRRANLDQFGRDVGYYVPPELRSLLGLVADMSPTATLERAGQATQRAMDPSRTGRERIGDVGAMLSETAAMAAPVAVAGRAAIPAARAAQEGLLGFSMGAQDLGRTVIDRLNQPGPMPTLYSNPLPGRGILSSELDPFGYQSTRLRDYLDQTQIEARDLPIAPRTPRSWEETEGMVVLPFYGDRTAGQREILGVNDTQFSAPVLAEGGVDFMRGPAAMADDAIWASNANITSRLQNTAAEAQRQFPERQILGVTGSMAPNANDFATFTAETVAELVPSARISAADARRFDDIMLAQDPTFPGVFSDQLRSWAASTTSPMRKSFIRLMEAAPMQQAGFPSPGVGRYAVTDPTQREMSAGQFGLGAAIMDPSAPRLFNAPRGNQYQAQVPHSTYNTQITGQYFGSLPPVPQGLLFRDLYDRMEGQTTKSGQPLTEAHRTHAIKTIVPTQEMTPRVIEGILQYLSRAGQ